VRTNHIRKSVRVPNHDIKISISELLFINTKTFQRLNYIKQLGLAYFVYPFALHTRASHCLDCLHIAQKFVDELKVNINQSTLLRDAERKEILKRLEDDTESIRAGAILHDIMHIPYAHTLEDENGILQKGDKSKRINIIIEKLRDELNTLGSSRLSNIEHLTSYRIFSFPDQDKFKNTLDRAKYLLDDAKKILWTIAFHDDIEKRISTKKEAGILKEQIFEKVKKEIEREKNVKILEANRYYIADIIGNTISADLLSYILRDPQFTGIESTPGGWYRLFDYLEIVKDEVGRNRLVIKLTKKGEWRQDVFSTIIRILNTRYDITEQITYHHAKLSASAMLGKIAYLCGLSEWDEIKGENSEWTILYEIGDEGFFKLLDDRIRKIKEGSISSRTIKDGEGAEKLLECLRCRRLHKRFHVVSQSQRKGPGGFDLAEKYSNPLERWKLEERIEDKYNLTQGSVILFCPKRKGTLKEAKALVLYEKIKSDGNLERVIEPLNSDECIEFVEIERGKSTAAKIKNVAQQYEDLWKLYVFVDPSVIPIYGYEIKEILNKELGYCSSFDLSYLELMEEYKLSKDISQEVTEIGIAEIDRAKAFEKIPVAIEEISGRDKKLDFSWIETNLKEILGLVKNLVSEPKEPQRKLPL